MHLDHALVGTTIGMSGESSSMLKNLPSTNSDEKYANCLASASTSIIFF
jgi:hypothetical protein